jgi:hypothetical protein|tara:strand:- start:406 stop:648 length:243 start_codon:yes stop_codon:yes gene_type:complete
MKNIPLDAENLVLSFLYKPLKNRKRCCAVIKNKKICMKSTQTKEIFCTLHLKIFQKALNSSNIFESIYLKSLYLKRTQKN